jgi:hypothetical protein
VNYDEETLMAYADGELDEAKRAEIAAAVERDPELAQRVARHRALRAELEGAYSSVLGSPVPERLLKAATPAPEPGTRRGTVVQFPVRAARAPASSWRWREWGAMAASVALGAVISWKLFAPSEAGLIAAGNDGLVASGTLAKALDTQLASTQGGSEPVLIGLTFRTQDGRYCRSFALPGAATAGLACRAGDQWLIPVTATAAGGADAIRQAASPPPAVLQGIQVRISGEALDATGEANAREHGWNPGYGAR